MAMTLFPPPKVQFSDNNGVPYSGGKVYFYEPGTTTPKDTYTDQTGDTANPSPVILDSRGEAAIWLNGFYKVNLKTSDDVQVSGYPIDNVSSGSASTSVTITEWTSPGDTPTYISATQFSVLGDQSTVYQVNRRIKCTVGASIYYGVITAVAYTTLTTVTISLDSGNLTASLSIVDVGILTVTNPSIPESARKVANATISGHAVNAGQVQAGSLTYVADTGTADAYAGALAPAITAYITNMVFKMRIANANTITAPTLNLNSIGTKTIKRINGASLNVGDLSVGHLAFFYYTGTDMILLNPALHNHSDANQGGITVKGQVVQVAHTKHTNLVSGSTVIPFDDTAPQNTEGDEYYTVAITPKDSNNILLVEALVKGSVAANVAVIAALFQDSIASALDVSATPYPGTTVSEQNHFHLSLKHKMSAGSTSLITFKIRVGGSGASTIYLNGDSTGRKFGNTMGSFLTVTEIQA